MPVKAKPEDQPFLRRLWTKNVQQNTYQFTCHVFGATDSPCVACYAFQSFATHHVHIKPEIQQVISEDINIDDLFTAFDTVDAGTKLRRN